MIVIDASAALETLLRTSAADSTDWWLFESGEALHAPHLIDVEVAQVLRRYVRAGEYTADFCFAALRDFSDFPITRYRHDFLLPRIWDLRDNLSAYDAAYVSLAEILDAPLLTRDRRLANARGHDARIELV